MDYINYLIDSGGQFYRQIVSRDEQKLTTVLTITSATAILAYCLLYRNKHTIRNNKDASGGLIKEIPTPGSSYFYFGHMLVLGKLPSKKISEWHRELGPLLKINMGRKTWITVDDPELAHKIFVTHGALSSSRPYSTFGNEYYTFKGHGKGIVFSQPGHDWKKNRTAALSILAPKQIEKHMSSIIHEAENLTQRLISNTSQHGSTNPFKFLELNSLNVIFDVGFGRKFESVDDPAFIKISEVIETTMKYAGLDEDMATFLPIFSILDYFVGKQKKWKNFIDNERNVLYRELVREALTKSKANVIHSLDQYGFTEEEKIVFMSDLIAGGTDTVSVTLSWNFAIMCHHPEVQKVVTAEIDRFVKEHDGRLPTFAERTELPHCISVIKECMRYRPTTIFGLAHHIDQEILVDDYIIPQGSTIICNMDSTHKNPQRYPDPEQFKPERFLGNLKTMQSAANGKLEERDHFNFGWGRRICPAIYLAEVEIFTAFIHVMANCFIEPVNELSYPDINDAVNAGLTTLPLPYEVKFTKR